MEKVNYRGYVIHIGENSCSIYTGSEDLLITLAPGFHITLAQLVDRGKVWLDGFLEGHETGKNRENKELLEELEKFIEKQRCS